MRNLMYYVLAVTLTWLSIGNLMAQEKRQIRFPEKGTFFLKGKVMNVPKGMDMFELAVCDPFENVAHEIALNEDGTFQKEMPVYGTQDLYLYLNATITLFTYPGDTIYLNFDVADLPNSIRLSGVTEERTRELDLSMVLHHKFRESFLELNRASNKRNMKGVGVDSVAIAQTRAYIDNYSATVKEYVKTHGEIAHKGYLLQRGYFSPLIFMIDVDAMTLLHRMKLRCENDVNGHFTYPDFNPFTSSAATSFMYSHLNAMIGNIANISPFERVEVCKRRIQIAELMIQDKAVLDWFIAKDAKRSLMGYRLPDKEGREMGEWVLQKITTPRAQQILSEYIQQNCVRLAKGQPAPEFTLKGLDGRSVSLASLKGKYVYIDFWSDGCAPCIQEFKKLEELHKKYAVYEDRLTYVYICLGSSEKRWKELVEKYKLKGVNLHATSFSDPQIEEYRVFSVPTYMLIDPEGKIVERDAHRPSFLLMSMPNIFDEIFKSKN